MEALLDELFAACHRDVYAYLYSLCRDASLAEDLTGEVFLEAVRSIRGFRGEADCKTWLFSIARHRWLAWLRKKKRQPQLEALQDFLPDGGESPEDLARYTDLLTRVRRLLDKEPPRTRKIVAMRLDGYSFYEIGLACGVSESSARVIDHRAKARIRDALQKEGYDGQ